MSRQQLWTDLDVSERLVILEKVREKAWSGLDYNSHQPSTISFVPPSKVEDSLRRDYTSMQQNFIYGDSLPYDILINRIKELQQRFRELNS